MWVEGDNRAAAARQRRTGTEPPSANVSVGRGCLLGVGRLSPITTSTAPLAAPSTGSPTGAGVEVEADDASAAFASASRLRFRCRAAPRRTVRPFGLAAAGAPASSSFLTWSAAAFDVSTAPAFGDVAVASTASAARRSSTAIRKAPRRTLPSPNRRHHSSHSAARMRARRSSAAGREHCHMSVSRWLQKRERVSPWMRRREVWHSVRVSR